MSKKRSVASSEAAPPPELPTFFVDRCLGAGVVPVALRIAGLNVEVHKDHFRPDTEDSEWISAVGSRGWIILTKDSRIRSRQIEIIALLKSATPSFVLTSANATGLQNAEAIIAALPQIRRMINKYPAPFLANVTATGAVKMILTTAEMLKKID